MPKVIGYLRVSTADQDTEKNKAKVLDFANRKGFVGQVEFIEEKISGRVSWENRKLKQVVDSLSADDILIAPELSRIGRSVVDIMNILKVCSQKAVSVYAVKEDFQVNGTSMKDKVMRSLFSLMAEVESDLISMRTKEGMAKAKKDGVKLGRPKGSGSSKLDKHREKIIELLKHGSTKKYIAERFDITPAGLYMWLKKHDLNDTKPEPNPQ